jgi:hypothetical protein
VHRIHLLGVLASVDERGFAKVEEMVSSESTAAQVEVGVRVLKETYAMKMARAAKLTDREAATEALGGLSREILRTIWYNAHLAAEDWVKRDMGVASTLLSLVDLVLKALPHSENMDGDIQETIQVRRSRAATA